MTTVPHRPHQGRSLLRGGVVHSPTQQLATAMLAVDGVVAWIGGEAAAQADVDSADSVVQLEGRLVTPGFVDAHVHLAQTGMALQSVNLSLAGSLIETLDALATYASSFTGSVLFAQGWDETHWPESRAPTMSEVDRAVGDLPAYVARVDSHSAVISGALLARHPELVELDGWSADGRVERAAHHAAREVTHALGTRGDRSTAIALALRQAASRGVTSVHELNAPHIAPFGDFAIIASLESTGTVPEVVAYWGALLDGEVEADFLSGHAGDLCVDGAIGSHTAALSTPYDDDPSTSGHLYLDRNQVRDHVVACTRAGTQGGFHVIGERAMLEVAAGFEAAASLVGSDALVAARHRLEHVEMPTQDDIETMARLGIVASVQPVFDALWGGSDDLYERRLGARRAEAMNPLATMAKAGVVLAFGSDSPITTLEPWNAVRAAALHHQPTQRLTVRGAFEAHTRGGHRARRNDDGGVLIPGAPATYAVWEVPGGLGVQQSDDALPVLHPDLPLPTCVQSVVSGRSIFDAGWAAAADPATEGEYR
ncbi:MAG: amidohydrolase [Nocardioidaceae bacterium]